MYRKLPPLNPVRAFDAVARHGSFSAAAEELNVTTAAVSLQVKTLENYLKLPLFVRTPRALKLTEQAVACLPAVTAALDLLGDAANRWSAMANVGVLRVRALPAFAELWLIPRLPRFAAYCPGVDVRIATLPGWQPGAGLDCDVAIHFARLDFAGRRIFADSFVPMCSPRYAEATRIPLSCPPDLRFHTLLHIDYAGFGLEVAGWPDWLRHFGLDTADAGQRLHFDSLCPALRAAQDGMGVVLAPRRLTADLVAQGRLVRPFEVQVPATKGYFLVCDDVIAALPRVEAFRRWILDEAKEEGNLPVEASH